MKTLTKTVLIIDDESDTRTCLYDLLRAQGYHVLTYADPFEALEHLHAIQPDVILLDHVMPQIEGTRFLPMLRGAAPEVPVLMLSAYANPEEFLEALELGAADVMCKPFAAADLLTRLGQLLGRRS